MNRLFIGISVFGRRGASGPNGAPSNLSTVVYSSTQINATVIVNATNADGLKWYYSSDGVNYSLHGTSLSGSYSYTSLTEGTIYNFYCTNYKGSKESLPSNLVIADTLYSCIPKIYPEPLIYNNNIRSIVNVGGTYHLFNEINIGYTLFQWGITKRTSSDGITFSAASAKLFPFGGSGSYDEKGQADPTVIYDGVNDWKMWFDAKTNANTWISIGYATSADGTAWSAYGAVLNKGSAGEWDDVFVHHPSVVKDGSTYYMFYAGAKSTSATVYKIGLATSSDGINWSKYASNPVITVGSVGQWDRGYVRPSNPIKLNGLWYMWYWGYDGTNNSMGLATSPDLQTWTKRGKLFGDPTGIDGGQQITATTAIVVEGNNTDDKIINLWYSDYKGVNHQVDCSITRFAKIALKSLSAIAVVGTPAKNYGDLFTELYTDTLYAANYIYASQITIGEDCTVDTMILFISPSSKPVTGNIKCALYANNAGNTGALLGITDQKAWSDIVADNLIIFTFTSPLTLSAGTYWMATWSSQGFYVNRTAGGSANNWGIKSIAFGNFPDPLTLTAFDTFNGLSWYVTRVSFNKFTSTSGNIWQIALTVNPTYIFFNGAQGNKQLSQVAVDSEFDWYWESNVLYIFCIVNPNVRYQISYV